MVTPDFNQFRKKALLFSRSMHVPPTGASAIAGLVAVKLERARAVSFDIFDTLTSRSVYHPEDVFKFLPDQPAFQALGLDPNVDIPPARFKAEHATYQSLLEETGQANANLREIYRTFCRRVGADPRHAEALARAEEEVELALAIVNEEVRFLFDEAVRLGKPIAFVSDTYHRPEFLARLLAQCGYADPARPIYSSCHYRKSKGDGKIFAVVLEHLKLAPGDLLHIGDNGQSDHVIPGKMGIETLWHPFRAHEDPVPDYHDGTEQLHSQIKALTERIRMPRREPVDFWYRLGYTVAGPLLSGFSLWLRRHFIQDKISRAYFLLRDGALIHRVYRIVAGDSTPCPTQTIPSSRRAMVFPLLDLDSDLVLPKLFVSAPGDRRPVGDFLRRLQIDPRPFAKEIAAVGLVNPQHVIDGAAEQYRLIQLFKQPRLTRAIIDQARAERALLIDYLRQEGMTAAGHVALVDVGWNGSIQQAITTLFQTEKLPPAVTGYYVGTSTGFGGARHAELSAHAYLFQLGQPKATTRILTQGCEVLEALCSSEEGSLFSFRREGPQVVPIFDEPETNEETLHHLESLHDGAAAFASDFKTQIDRQGWQTLPQEVAMENLLRLITRPTSEEAVQLGQVIHCENLGTRRGRPLAVFRPESAEPQELWEDYRNAYWKQGLLNQPTAQSAQLRTLLWLLEDTVPGFKAL
jgi:predicted HAD superfamily hydrolase